MRGRVVLVCMAIGLAGCGGCDGADDAPPLGPRTEIVDPGTGEPNAAPLWPVVPGSVFSPASPGAPVHVSGPLAIGGVTVLRVSRAGRVTGYAEPKPSEPTFVKYVSRTDEGVLLHGLQRAGMFAAPVLLVPAEVRLGMRWIARTDGDAPRFVFEVTAREHALTMYGEGTTWTIAIDDRALTDVRPAEGADYEVTYFEGRGPVRGLPFAMGDADWTPTSAVIPLDAPAAPARTYPLATPRRLLDGAPVVEGKLVQRVSFIDDPARYGDGFLVAMYGREPVLGPFGYTEDDFGGCTIAGPTGYAAPTACAEAAGVAITTGGVRGEVVTNVAGRVYPHDTGCQLGDDCSFLDMLGVYAAGAELRGLARGASVIDDFLFGTLDPARARDNLTTASLRHVKGVFRNLPITDELWLAREDGADLAIGIPVLGGLAAGRIDAEGITHGGTVALPLDEPLSVAAHVGEQRWLRATADGDIDRVVLEAAGLRVVPLVHVDVPAGAFVVGAMLQDARIVVAIQEQFAGYDAQIDPATGERDPYVEPRFGALTLWEVPLPATAAAAAPPPVITATALGRDARVCWTGGGTPDLDPAHWTLGQGSQPALVVAAGTEGACVLLVRQPAQLTMTAGQWAIEGPVPGVGRVAIALDPPLAFDRGAEIAAEQPEDLRLAGTPVFPLAGGGLVSELYVYGPGATYAHGYGHVVANETVVPDRGGAGLWYPLVDGTGRVMLSTRDARRMFTVPGTGPATLTPVFGPGVVVSHGGIEGGLLHPDGTLTPLATGLDRLWVWPDGRVCGTLPAEPTALRCRTPAGVDTLVGSWSCTAPLGFGPAGTVYALDSTGAGSLCVLSVQGASIVTQSVTLASYGLTQAAQLLQAPDGKAYLYEEFPGATATSVRHVMIDLDDALVSTSNVIGYLDQPFLLGEARAKIVAEDGLLTIFPAGAVDTLPRVIRIPRP